MDNNLRILGEFIGHLAVGSAMFVALMLFGGLINFVVHWAEPLLNDVYFVDLMIMAERIILYADVLFITWWAIYSTYRAIKEMMTHE